MLFCQFVRGGGTYSQGDARAQVSVSSDLYSYLHELWLREVPITELS